jgi:hypothetical protein
MECWIEIQPDKDGYTGRECPACERYFKIKYGTGLPNATECHCPYCNHIGAQNEFSTKQQIEYAASVALNKISSDLLTEMKKLEKSPDPNAFISIGISVKGQPTPIAYYLEKELEERVTCAACTLEYTIYGTFGYCPDCGIHNSLQIVNVNFDLVLKVLALVPGSSEEIAAKLIENALEDVISSFDGFGREHCSKLPLKVSFQNIAAAKDKLLSELGIDITDGLGIAQCNFICEQFQKRHLLAHKMGIIDEEFVSRTGCSASLIGRKISIREQEVHLLVGYLKIVASNLFNGVARN